MNCGWLNGFFDSDECAVCRRFSAWCPRLRGCRSCATSAGTDGDAGGVEVAAEGFGMYADVHSGRVYCVLIRCAVASGVGNRLLLALHCDDRIGGPRRWQGAPSRSSRPLSRRRPFPPMAVPIRIALRLARRVVERGAHGCQGRSCRRFDARLPGGRLPF